MQGTGGNRSRTTSGRSATRRRSASLACSLAAIVVVASALSGSSAASAARTVGGLPIVGGAHPYVAGKLLVRFRGDVSAAAISRVNASLGATTVRAYHIVPNLRLLQLPHSLDVPGAVAAYQRLPEVMYAEPDFLSHIDDTTPNDPSFNLQWDWKNTGQLGGTPGDDVDAVKAWDLSIGSNAVAVGLLDTGVQTQPHVHTDLAANLWNNMPECSGLPGVDDEGDGYVDDCHGIDTINHDSDPDDDFGHGTHTAGTMGAVGNNGIGVTGMSWHVTIVPCKSHDNTGNGTNDSLVECLQFLQDWKDRGLNIVSTNNSYGGCLEACDYSQSLYDAIKGHMQHGILFVASAGNDAANNDTTPKYPTNYYLPNVIGVAATDNNDARASFSNYGAHTVSLGAPGQSVYSTYSNPDDGYAYLSGTSMAAPHVAGLAGLLEAFNPSLDWRALKNLILAGGEVKPSMQGITVTDRRMNAYGSMTCSNVPVFGPLRPLPNATGGTQPLSALNINCAAPGGGLTVTVTPGGNTFTLSDNGKKADIAAGDGIYSSLWTPCATGTYTFSYSNGSTDSATVTGLVPCIRLQPSSGPPGSTTTVKGRGFSPNESVTIMFDTGVVGTTTANGTGSISKVITIPPGARRGQHTVTATGATSNLPTQGPFKVTM
ncbi:MAG TPA: S8 family peptidase [Actinomycetota bacterium]